MHDSFLLGFFFIVLPGGQLEPCIGSASEGADSGDAVISQEQCRTSTGSFVWSSAEQHDFPIARDFPVPHRQFLRRNPNGAGN